MLQSGDRVRLQKSLGMDSRLIVGKVYEIGTLTDTTYIIRDAITRVAVVAVKIDELDDYFVKEEKKYWTEWQGILQRDNLIGYFRTNGKKVQVKAYETKAEATCNKTDDFNLKIGINLALLRCKQKCAYLVKEDVNVFVKETEGELKSLFDNVINKRDNQNKVTDKATDNTSEQNDTDKDGQE